MQAQARAQKWAFVFIFRPVMKGVDIMAEIKYKSVEISCIVEDEKYEDMTVYYTRGKCKMKKRKIEAIIKKHLAWTYEADIFKDVFVACEPTTLWDSDWRIHINVHGLSAKEVLKLRAARKQIEKEILAH